MLSAITWDVDRVTNKLSKIKLNETTFVRFRSDSSVPITFTVCAVCFPLRWSVHVNYGAWTFIMICNIGPNSALCSTNLNKCWCASWGFHGSYCEEYCALEPSSPEDGAHSSETSMKYYHTIQRHFPEDSNQMLTRLKSTCNYEEYGPLLRNAVYIRGSPTFRRKISLPPSGWAK
jgi:hypothetical protein